jgi:CHAT domain-containing protein/Tfp pilus assembly protein PilF
MNCRSFSGLMLFVALSATVLAQEPKPPKLTPEEQKLDAEAKKLDKEGMQLYQQGKPAAAAEKARQVLAIYENLYPTAKDPDGHPDLAGSLNQLGDCLEAMGQLEQALVVFRQCMTMREKLYPAAKYPEGHTDRATTIQNVGYVLQGMGQLEQALTFYRQALAMNQKLYPAAKYPDGHGDLALTLMFMGHGLQAIGEMEQALLFLRQCLQMYQKLYPASKYPNGHPLLATSLNNLGHVHSQIGQTAQALPLYQQSLNMRRQLFPAEKYPDGHTELAVSLNNLGFILQDMGRAKESVSFHRQSLEMRQRLFPAAKYPNGHADIAISLKNMGTVHVDLGQIEQAVDFFRQSLEMKQKLYPAARYPDGHPNLARGLNDLGHALLLAGQLEQAATFVRQSLAMYQKLYVAAKYPDGHLDVAVILKNLGMILQALGQDEQAVPFYRQSVEMRHRLLRRELALASEEAAFDKIADQPWHRDYYLSGTRTAPMPADTVYGDIWPMRSIVTRVLEQRLANARAAGTEVGDKLDQLRDLRRRIEYLLQGSRLKADERAKQLAALADERDRLERELLAAVPALKHWQELDQLGPVDLVKALPPGAVFIDFVRYRRCEFVDQKEKLTSSYVAFILARDRPIQRIELDYAKPIEDAITSWRRAIEARRTDPAATTLTARLWDRLAAHLPAGTRTLYIAAEGNLARLPWAALPIAKERVLLEDYAVAMVPHGAFLLDHLKFPRSNTGAETLLTLGGVDYNSATWPVLPGTAVEIEALTSLSPAAPMRLTKSDATATRLKETLPKGRYAHLATHGEFNANELTKEKERAAKAADIQMAASEPRNVAAKNPLGYVGLVLADGEVLSGLGIVDLKLDNLKLVTLSACETGLGEFTGGEGVQGLQRAFHLAGCPNVVASLWKVNDAATVALMAKFYHELWVNKKPPIEALREAQLTIYRHPERIPVLAGERGKPDFAKTVELKIEPRASASAEKRTPTKLWAAFVLSGVGK